jgi:type IV secretory pathway TraG/TraD family ATPase VirD4
VLPIVIDLLNRSWIAIPIFYTLTVWGLIAGFRRGGVPAENRIVRALLTGIPVMLGALIAWNIIIALCAAPGAPGQFAGLEMALALVFIPCSSALTGVALARRKPTNPVERGTLIIDHRAQKPHTRSSGEMTLVGHLMSPLDETKHFKIMGTTGTGKSTAIGEILTGAFARGDRGIIADPDGSYARQFYDPARGDVILNPFDPRAARWNLFAEIVEPHDADQLARSLVPDYDGQDRNWRNYARTLLTATLRQIHRTSEPNLADLYSVLVTATEDDLRDLLDGTPAAPFVSKDNGKFLGSVRSIAMQHLAFLEHLLRQNEGDPLSVRQWIREGRGVLFLPYSANQIASLRNVISAWMRLAIFETMSLEERDHKVWFVVDELEALGAIDGLKDALTRLRKFGGRCVLGFQSIAQVRGTYGDSEAQTIVENCGNTVILRCSASERGGTAEFASRLIGQREVTRQQLSYSRPRKPLGFLNQTRTETDQITTEDAVMASEIEQLPDLSGFLKMASRPEWYRVTLHRQ